MRSLIAAVTIVATAQLALGADMGGLRDCAKWLDGERLRGTLFHDPLVEPMGPMNWLPASDEGAGRAHRPVTLHGWHNVVILPDDDGRIRIDLQALGGDGHFTDTIYALFDAEGEQLAAGVLAAGETGQVAMVVDDAKPHILMLNSGPASGSKCRLTVGNSWGIDAAPRGSYNRTPLHYHFLRDLKLGGFNLAMIDFERLPQEFVTDGGLDKWTEMVKEWTDYARECELRVMPALDLGGTKWEVEAWGDAPKGLYIDPDPELPLAPCPLREVYWERILLRRARKIAKLSLDNPYIVGIGIDPEMYQCWRYGHYMLTGTCFCDHCLGGFLEERGPERDILADKKDANERHEWLKENELTADYYDYLADEMTEMAAWCRREIHEINPDLLLNMFVIDIGNWFCEGIARGFSQPDLPVVNFCEHTYYSVGYDREWLDKTHAMYRKWGANVLQGSALWDLHFPPTKPGFLAAHAYNLAVNDEGWWYWPGDQLYRDYGSRYAYLEEPAYFEDYWQGCAWANGQIAKKMADSGLESPLAEAEVVPWKGKIKRGNPETEEQIMRRQNEPSLPVQVSPPAELYFAVPERTTAFDLIVQARGPDNAAAVEIRDPEGNVAARAEGELDEPKTLSIEATEPGIWSLAVSRAQQAAPDAPAHLGIRFENLRSALCTCPEYLLAPATKKPGLVGHWPMDEGEGNVVEDVSQEVKYSGRMRDCEWAEGKAGKCLQFDGESGRVGISDVFSYHNMDEFTLSAWIKLAGLPVQGNGNSIIGKGPEAPVQHFWWWIGYPPNYTLILEMGSEEHRWGAGFASGPVDWKIGRWYHVAAVFRCEGGTSTVVHYRDGEQIAERTRDEAFHSGSYDMNIGRYHGAMHWMDGAIDEVKIWDRALSADEIRAEYTRYHGE